MKKVKDWGRWRDYRVGALTCLSDDELVSCKTCGRPTDKTSTKLCDGCWEVEHRLAEYLRDGGAVAAKILKAALKAGGFDRAR